MATSDIAGDRFEVLECAGSGGMGAVYRAIDKTTGEVVALKVLRDTSADSTSRFIKEARVLAELSHPNIVRYITHGVAPSGAPFLAMEWLEGEDLDDRLTRQRLTVEESVDLARRAARALASAHERGIVHRDIKPSNIYLVGGSLEDIRLLDFGIARVIQGGRPITFTGNVLGTPGYMAPEQARGEVESLSARADVFSLGCVLYECLTGQPAFAGTNVMALLAKLLLEDPAPIRQLRPEVPEALDALVTRMIAKDPAKRPANGEDVAAALDNLGEAGSIEEGASPREPSESAITDTEARLVSVVAVVPRSAMESLDMASTMAPPLESIALLRRAAEPLGARVEAVAGGLAIAMLIGTGSATDQVSLAARCALRARALLPSEQIALLTGRAVNTGRLPVGEVLDRAAGMLEKLDAGPDRQRGREIFIDEVTRSLLDARFEVTEEDGRVVLLGEREIAEEARTLLGKPTPFVGRERETRSLTGAIEESLEERAARAILVTAAAGIGKSRLRHELIERLRERHPDLLIIRGRADWIGAGSAFSMLRGALRTALGIEASDAPDVQRGKVVDAASACEAASLGEEESQRLLVAEFLGELMGVPFPDASSPRLRAARQNASIMASRTQDAFVDFMRATASARPILWALEDLHWGDAPSVKLLDAALRELRELPFIVLAFARPEVHEVFPKLWAERALYSIHLGPLSRRAAESLVKAALGTTADPMRVAAIIDRAEGNAFFLEELIRAVAEGRGEELPETVLGMVEARIAALPVPARRLLRAASVFGQTFWQNGALALLGQGGARATLKDVFQELVERELLTPRLERRFRDEDEYAFRHALVRQAAYEMLTERDRSLGHRLAGQWLERAGERDAIVLAKHFEKGGDAARAASYYARAAEQAQMSGDFQAAAERVESALACDPDDETKAALFSVQAGSHLYVNEYSKAIERAEAALALAAPGSLTYYRSLTDAIASAMMVGAQGTLARLSPALLDLQPSPKTAGITARAFGTVMMALVLAGAREEGARYLARMEEVIAPHCERDPFAAGFVEHARAFWSRYVEQRPFQALQRELACLHHLEEAGARLFIPLALAHVGLDYLLLGAYDAAEGALNRALAADESGGLQHGFAAYCKCRMLLDSGRLDEARALAVSVRDAARARGDRILGPNAALAVVDVLVQRGLFDEAEAEARSLGDPAVLPLSIRPSLHLLLAEIRLRRGEAAEALRLVDEAIAAREASGGMASVRLERMALLRAEALHAAGSIEAAREELRSVLSKLLERAYDIDDAELRRSFLENVRAHARTLELARAWLEEASPEANTSEMAAPTPESTTEEPPATSPST